MNFFCGQLQRSGSIYFCMNRIVSWFLSLLLILFCGCAPTKRVARPFLRSGYGEDALHGHTAYADMVLIYPDPDAMQEVLDCALERIGFDHDPKEYVDIYESQARAYDELVSATSLAYVRYCQDISDKERAAEYGKLNSSLYPIQYRLARLEKELMDRWGYHQERGSAYAETLDRLRRQDASQIRMLRNREDDLCRRYEQLDSSYRLKFQGRTWSRMVSS